MNNLKILTDAACQYLHEVDGAQLSFDHPQHNEVSLRHAIASHSFTPLEAYEGMDNETIAAEIFHLEEVLKYQVPTVVARIPFEGFYETNLGADMDEANEDVESWPDGFLSSVAYAYTRQWQQETDIPVTFHRLTSPREYNFETDHIEVVIPTSFVKGMQFALLADQGFHDYVKEHCSHSSGFISFLPNDPDSWNSKWGFKEITVALAYITETRFPDVAETVREHLNGNGELMC